MSPWVVALLAWLLSTAVVTPLVLFLVLVLAGPHGGVLSPELAPVTLAGGWLLVLGLPLYLARLVYQRTSRRQSPAP